jgi:hypothetical protein
VSRNAAAAELADLIVQINAMCQQGERLAASSGGLVDQKWFGAARTSMGLACGDLQQKGLWMPTPKEEVKA